jgi:hypothetical protein
MATALANANKSFDSTGACRDFWIKITKPDGTPLSIGTGATTVIWGVENPFYEDLAILEALLNITTEDDDDIDMDIGLSDDATGTNKGSEICDSAINTAACVTRLTDPGDRTDGTVVAPLWLAKGTSTDAFITFYQTGASTHAVLRFNLLLRVMPKKDLL